MSIQDKVLLRKIKKREKNKLRLIQLKQNDTPDEGNCFFINLNSKVILKITFQVILIQY